MLQALGDRDLGWLGGKTGIPVTTLSDYVRRGITRADNALAIATALDVSMDWLVAGHIRAGASTPPVNSVAMSADEHRRIDAPQEEMFAVPMVGATLSAGPGSIVTEAGYQAGWSFPLKWLKATFGHIARLRMMRVVGDSQEPLLSENDWVMIDTSKNALRDGLCAVRLDETLMVKRVQVEGRVIRLLSTNPAYPPIVLDTREQGRDFAIIGHVVWSSKTYTAS